MNLKATPTLPSRTAQEHLCSPDGGCAKPFTKVTEVDSCAYRARAQHALLCSARSAALRQPSAGTLGFAGGRLPIIAFPLAVLPENLACPQGIFKIVLAATSLHLLFWGQKDHVRDLNRRMLMLNLGAWPSTRAQVSTAPKLVRVCMHLFHKRRAIFR